MTASIGSAPRANHAVLTTPAPPDAVKAWLAEVAARAHLLSVGRSIDLYKDIGRRPRSPSATDSRRLAGSHLVGHTRMATESAVTPEHAHPFTAGEDFCLVHNGSLSNPYSVRRKLEPLGIQFETDNDTEAACRFLEWRMREGDDLDDGAAARLRRARRLLHVPDGHATSKLLLVRDAFACKPAIVAETDDYVAIASEFRSLAHLPGVKNAHVFEPKPEEMYSWKA